MTTNLTKTFNPFFEVIREPAKVTFNGETKEINKDVLLNADTGDVLGVVSKGYALVQNNDVRDFFETAFEKYDVSIIGDHGSNSGDRWIREMVFNDDKFVKEIIPGDAVKLKLKLWNGYNGTTSVGYALEGYRLVCTNGMMGWKNMFSTKLPHLGNDIINTIRNSFSTKFENYTKVFDKMGDWATKPYLKSDFNKFIGDRTKEAGEKTTTIKYLSEKQAEGIKSLYPVVMNKYNENETKWGAYNVITAIATHHTATKSTNSHLFTQGYKRTERLAEDFIKIG